MMAAGEFKAAAAALFPKASARKLEALEALAREAFRAETPLEFNQRVDDRLGLVTDRATRRQIDRLLAQRLGVMGPAAVKATLEGTAFAMLDRSDRAELAALYLGEELPLAEYFRLVDEEVAAGQREILDEICAGALHSLKPSP